MGRHRQQLILFVFLISAWAIPALGQQGAFTTIRSYQTLSALGAIACSTTNASGLPEAAVVNDGANNGVYWCNGANSWTKISSGGGGGGSPGTPPGSVQGNVANSFAAIPGFSFNTSSGALTVSPTSDAVPMTIAPSVSSPTANLYSIYNSSSYATTYTVTSPGCSFSTPITCTLTTAAGIVNPSQVSVTGVGGNTNANGTFEATVSGSMITLVGSAGNAAWTLGGTVTILPVQRLGYSSGSSVFGYGCPRPSGGASFVVCNTNQAWAPFVAVDALGENSSGHVGKFGSVNNNTAGAPFFQYLDFMRGTNSDSTGGTVSMSVGHGGFAFEATAPETVPEVGLDGELHASSGCANNGPAWVYKATSSETCLGGATNAGNFVSQHTYTVDGVTSGLTSLATVVNTANLAGFKAFQVYDLSCGDNLAPAATGSEWTIFPGERLHVILGDCDTPWLFDQNVVIPQGSTLIHAGGGSNKGGTPRGAVLQPTTAFSSVLVTDPTVTPTWASNTSCTNNSSYTSGSVYAVYSWVNTANLQTRYSPESVAQTGMGASTCAVFNRPTAATNALFYNLYLESSNTDAGAGATFYGQFPVSQATVTVSAANQAGASFPSGTNATVAGVVIQDGSPWLSGSASGSMVWGIDVSCAAAYTTPECQVGLYNADGEERSGFWYDSANEVSMFGMVAEGCNGRLCAINSIIVGNQINNSSLGATACSGSPCNPGAVTEGNSPPYGPASVLLDTARLWQFEGLTATPNVNGSLTKYCVDVEGSISPALSPGEMNTIRNVHCEGPGGSSHLTAALECHNVQNCVADQIQGVNGSGAFQVQIDTGTTNANLTNIMAVPSDCPVNDVVNDVNCTTTPGFSTGQKIESYRMTPAGVFMGGNTWVQNPGGSTDIADWYTQSGGFTKTKTQWIDSAGTAHGFGSGGTPGGSAGQYQINNTTFAGAAALTNSSNSGVGSVIASQAGSGGTDIPALKVIPFGSPTSDIFQVTAPGSTGGNTCNLGTPTCWFYVDSSGITHMLAWTSAQNSIILGANAQTSASSLLGFGGSASTTGFAINGRDSTSTFNSCLYFDPLTANQISLECSHTGAGTTTKVLSTASNTQTLTNKSIAASEINSGTLAIAQGGTNAATAPNALINLFPAASEVGDLVYCATYSSGCTSWALLAGNTSGTKVLQETSAGAPSWVAGGGGSPSQDQVTGSAAQATATETAAGHNYTFAGVETAALTVPFVFTDANSTGNTSSGPLALGTTGTSTAAVNLYLVQAAAAGNFITACGGTSSITNGTVVCGTTQFSVGKTGIVGATELQVGNGAGVQANSTGNSIVNQGGQDAAVNSAVGGITNRGGDQTGAGGASSTGGNNLVRGGNNAGTNAASEGGSLFLASGQSTGATPGKQGLISAAGSEVGASTPVQWNLMCPSSTTAMTITNCGASPGNWMGVAEKVNAVTTVYIFSGYTLVNASAAVTIGDTVCAGTTAGQVTDSGGTSACALGSQVGIVRATSGTFELGDGTSITPTTTLPLILLARD